MSQVPNRPLRQLQSITITGAVLTTVASLVLSIPWGIPSLPTGGTGMSFVTSPRGIAFLGAVALSIVGILVMWRAQVQLKAGLDVERWTPTEIDGLRRWVNSRGWLALFWTGLLVIATGSLSIGSRHGTSPMLFVLLTCPMHAMSSLRAALRPPMDMAGVLYARDGMKPIWSEHWGERQEFFPCPRS